MSDPAFSRRSFLSAALVLAGSSASPSSATGWRLARSLGGRLVALRLGTIFREPESAAAVGRAYLRLRPEERDPSVLLARIELGQVGLGDLKALRTNLASGIRADFAEGRTLEIEGWVLSATEARLCALVALGRRSI